MLLKNTVIFILSLIVAILLSEFLLRVFFPQPVMPRFMVDSGFGNRVPAPNKTYYHSVPNDFSVTITTNSAGMRGDLEYEKKKPRGVYRICMLGDSFLFGYGVEDYEVVSYRLLELLGEGSYEVLNFGVSGYGQAEQLSLYQHRVKQYSCNHVTLLYYSNDPGNNIVSALYRLNENGELERDRESYLPGVKVQMPLYSLPVLGAAFAHSHTWSLIRNLLSRSLHASMLKSKGLDDYITEKRFAIDLTQALLARIQTGVENAGSGFSVLVIPHVSKDGTTLASNFPLVSAGVELTHVHNEPAYFDRQDYLEIDPHWNPQGHTKAAELLAAFFKDIR